MRPYATVSWHLRYANPLIKVTIVPRGKALGAAWYLPEERQITPTQALLDEMCSTLGGRAAEELFIGHISTARPMTWSASPNRPMPWWPTTA